MALRFSVSGVRGAVGPELTPQIAQNLARAFVKYSNGQKLVLGTDTRPSRGILRSAVIEGFSRSGCETIDLGIVPTPTVGIMVKEFGADGGVVITASHNELPDNGLKFFDRNGLFLNESEAMKLFSIYGIGGLPNAPSVGAVRDIRSPFETHLTRIFKNIRATEIGMRSFRVALDCVNGAGSIIIPKLLRDFGCKLFPIYTDIYGAFPHTPEPVAKNIKDLCELVVKKKADVGFAVDPDADRLHIVDENGDPIGEEATLQIAVEYILTYKTPEPKGVTIATNLSTTRGIDDIALRFGARVIRTKIGEINVTEQMIKHGSIIGGEGNGGVIWPTICMNRDSLTAIALTLEYMERSGKRMSEIAKGLPQYHMVKRKVLCSSKDEAQKIVESLKNIYKTGDINDIDGVKVSFDDGTWIHIRASNTESAIRIIAESKSEENSIELVLEAAKKLGIAKERLIS